MHQTPNRPTSEQGPHSGNSDGSSRSRGHLSEGRARSGIGPCEDPVPGDNSCFTITRRRCCGGQKEGLQVGEGARSFWRFYRSRSGFLEEGTRQAHEVARERPLEVQIKECREFISRSEQRLARLEADRQALAQLTERRSRLSRLESQQLEAPQPEPGVKLEQRIQVFVRECDALRAAATPVLHQENQSGAQKGAPRWTTFHQCPTMCKMWKGG